MKSASRKEDGRRRPFAPTRSPERRWPARAMRTSRCCWAPILRLHYHYVQHQTLVSPTRQNGGGACRCLHEPGCYLSAGRSICRHTYLCEVWLQPLRTCFGIRDAKRAGASTTGSNIYGRGEEVVDGARLPRPAVLHSLPTPNYKKKNIPRNHSLKHVCVVSPKPTVKTTQANRTIKSFRFTTYSSSMHIPPLLYVQQYTCKEPGVFFLLWAMQYD